MQQYVGQNERLFQNASCKKDQIIIHTWIRPKLQWKRKKCSRPVSLTRHNRALLTPAEEKRGPNHASQDEQVGGHESGHSPWKGHRLSCVCVREKGKGSQQRKSKNWKEPVRLRVGSLYCYIPGCMLD